MGYAVVLMGLIASVILYNNLVNLWPMYQKNGIYVSVSLALSALLIVLAGTLLGVSISEIGLRPVEVSESLVGLGGGLATSIPVFLLAMLYPSVVADERLRSLKPKDLTRRMFLRVPLGTALLEEVTFRGVLFAALLPYGIGMAVVVSSAAFGLWHVLPTMEMIRSNRPGAPLTVKLGAVVLGVLITGAAGLFFVWLRIESGGLAAPFLFHAALNSGATLWSYLPHKHLPTSALLVEAT